MKHLQAVLVPFIIIGLLFTLTSCGYSEADLEKARSEAYDDGFEEGRVEGYDDGYDDGFGDGLFDGMLNNDDTESSNSDIDYIVQGILEEARYYASEKSDDITLLDAMDIVSVYLDGHDPSGYPLPTKKEFEEAVDVLLRYAIFLEWNSESYSSIMEDYDPFYG